MQATQEERATILVVEDDETIKLMLRRALEKEYEVVEASDGIDGLVLATARPFPALVITDIMMSRLSGLDMVKRIRANEAVGDVPIIILSAKATPQEYSQGIRAGATRYVVKPFKVGELLGTVRSMIHATLDADEVELSSIEPPPRQALDGVEPADGDGEA